MKVYLHFTGYYYKKRLILPYFEADFYSLLNFVLILESKIFILKRKRFKND